MNIIRVSSGIEIEVNDVGETIVIPVEDMNFIDKYNRLIETFERISTEIQEKEGTLTAGEELKLIISKIKEIMDEINALFMDEQCCKKVFGDIIPSPYVVADFFEQLYPYVEKYTDERHKKIMAKYKKPVRRK